jgi:hypothetical protein
MEITRVIQKLYFAPGLHASDRTKSWVYSKRIWNYIEEVKFKGIEEVKVEDWNKYFYLCRVNNIYQI